MTKPIGVPKQMPHVGHGWFGPDNRGIQNYRTMRAYTMTDPLKSPYPWPGGKSTIAAEVWSRLGDVPNYVEPFAGSAAVLLLRPHDLDGKTETLNDLDGFITNALRAIAYAPEETAEWCDWPVSECDLTAVHLWLKAQREELTQRLFADPDYCDPCAAGRWLWGIASWIGDGWCVADGPWINVDGRLVDRRTIGVEQEGVTKKMPSVGGREEHSGTERGIQRYRNAPGVPRKMPEIGKSPNGQIDFNRKGVQAYRYREGVPKQMPVVGGNKPGTEYMGINRQDYAPPGALLAYFDRLAARLRRVRLLCGDWRRAVKDSVTVNHGLTGLFLDPEYPADEHDMTYHQGEKQQGEPHIWYQVAEWAAAHGDDKRLRIAVCGYWSEDADRIFPETWSRYRWEARGGYSNQSKDGRGRTNAKRECVWFSPSCIDPANDYAGTLFEGL